MHMFEYITDALHYAMCLWDVILSAQKSLTSKLWCHFRETLRHHCLTTAGESCIFSPVILSNATLQGTQSRAPSPSHIFSWLCPVSNVQRPIASLLSL